MARTHPIRWKQKPISIQSKRVVTIWTSTALAYKRLQHIWLSSREKYPLHNLRIQMQEEEKKNQSVTRCLDRGKPNGCVCVCSACVSFDCRYYPSKWYEMTASSAFLRTIFFLVVPSVNTANVAHSQPSTESDSFDVCQSRFGGRVSFVRSTLITPNASRRIKRQIQNRENGIKI